MPTGIFGKPLRAIYRFSHQNAQPPPSPLVGEGGRGNEGAKVFLRSLRRKTQQRSGHDPRSLHQQRRQG
jgi:hypothetical protein